VQQRGILTEHAMFPAASVMAGGFAHPGMQYLPSARSTKTKWKATAARNKDLNVSERWLAESGVRQLLSIAGWVNAQPTPML
jgi:hypothetical protein